MTRHIPILAMSAVVTLIGCATHQQSDAARHSNPSLRQATTPVDALAGEYRIAGRVSGVRIGATIRLDSSGRATYRGGSPGAPFLCDGAVQQDERRVTFSCGTLQMRLDVINGVVAPAGHIAFDVPKAARKAFDPFACLVFSADSGCSPLRETVVIQMRRVAGGVTAARVTPN